MEPITNVKVENFPSCDCFCVIGCPNRSIQLTNNWKEYRRRIYTPSEILVALNEREWSTHFSLEHLLPFEDSHSQADAQNKGAESETFKEEDGLTKMAYGELAVTRGHCLIPVTSMSYQGVDSQAIPNEPIKLHMGLHGIASKYTSDLRMHHGAE